MLETVTIQNFRSLKDVTLRLQKVNLLIGPNNSGKSNFLKGLATIKEYLFHGIQPPYFDFNRNYHKQLLKASFTRKYPITFGFRWGNMRYQEGADILYQLELIGYNPEDNNRLTYNEGFGISSDKIPHSFRLVDLPEALKLFSEFSAIYARNNLPNFPLAAPFLELQKFLNNRQSTSLRCTLSDGKILPENWGWMEGLFLDKFIDSSAYFDFDLEELFKSIKIYKPDPSIITRENMLLFGNEVKEDCSNLVAFLDNMRDLFPQIWNAIEKDLKRCLPDFEGINFDKVTIPGGLNVNGRQDSIGKKFGLLDKFGKTYWAEELSEGTIYFLAILAIIHQPNAPKLLLLEEPEKGIHPRRISEVMDLIFRLAEEKNIQVIITTHSTQVVDQFQDIPESVFVFELNEGETKVKNLLTDIIEPDNEKSDEMGYPKLDFSKHSLGEHWAIGFFGGVPAK